MALNQNPFAPMNFERFPPPSVILTAILLHACGWEISLCTIQGLTFTCLEVGSLGFCQFSSTSIGEWRETVQKRLSGKHVRGERNPSPVPLSLVRLCLSLWFHLTGPGQGRLDWTLSSTYLTRTDTTMLGWEVYVDCHTAGG